MNNEVVLKCVLIIELVWVEKYEKMGEKPPFLSNFEGWYRYQTEWYRYHKCSVHWYRYRIFGTGTQCFILDQRSYFDHNLVISYPN